MKIEFNRSYLFIAIRQTDADNVENKKDDRSHAVQNRTLLGV